MSPTNVAADAATILDTVAAGDVAIFPVDVGYAIVGNAEPAIRRIYEAKERSFAKPCGMFGSWELFNDVIEVDKRARAIVSAVIHDHGLPFSIVGPFRHDHAMFRDLAPFVIENATKAGTLDMLMNAGALHDAVARLSRAWRLPVLGSSANRSLSGSKFRLEDVEPDVRDAAAVTLDYGLCKYHNPKGLGSSIIDLTDFKTIRVGACYDQICTILVERFGVDLRAIGAA